MIQILAELWAQLDHMLAPLTADDWQKAHGAEWTFADLPYHVGYVDRLMVVEPIRFGRELPIEKQVELPFEQLLAAGDVQAGDFQALWTLPELMPTPDMSREVPVTAWP